MDSMSGRNCFSIRSLRHMDTPVKRSIHETWDNREHLPTTSTRINIKLNIIFRRSVRQTQSYIRLARLHRRRGHLDPANGEEGSGSRISGELR
jgi:hypothetical protein